MVDGGGRDFIHDFEAEEGDAEEGEAKGHADDDAGTNADAVAAPSATAPRATVVATENLIRSLMAVRQCSRIEAVQYSTVQYSTGHVETRDQPK